MQYNGEKPWDELDVVVCPGADGSYDFYEDAFETYAYEKGEWSEIPFRWNDAAKTLAIAERRGGYPEMPKTRVFHVRLAGTEIVKTVRYDGGAAEVKF